MATILMQSPLYHRLYSSYRAMTILMSVSTIKYRYVKSIHHSVSRHSKMENQFVVNCCVRGYHVYNTTSVDTISRRTAGDIL